MTFDRISDSYNMGSKYEIFGQINMKKPVLAYEFL